MKIGSKKNGHKKKKEFKKLILSSITLLLLILFDFPLEAQSIFKLPRPERIKLSNGLTVFYLYNPELPLVSFRLILAGAGTAFEPPELDGLANFTADLLLKGAGRLSPEEIAEAIDFMGASLDFSAADEYVIGSGESLSEHFPRLLQIAADGLISPWFSEEEFKKEQARRTDLVKAIKDNPSQAVRYYFLKAYFGSHPLGHISVGTEISLAKIKLADIRTFYKERYRPDQVLMAVVGQIEKEKLIKLLEASFGRWKASSRAPTVPLPPLPQPKGRTIVLVDKPDATQAYFVLGGPGLKMGDEISPAANVMNTLWGGRFTSWFNTELRIKRGLTYGASSSLESWKPGGIFRATSYTKSDQLGEMLTISIDLLRKGRQEGFSSEEVRSARNYILGQFPPTLETNASKALAYVRLSFYGLGFDYYDRYLDRIDKISLEEVNQAAARLLPGENFVLVVVGRAEEVREVLQKLGPVQEKKITDPGF
ncbi:MAG: insulinase family protein [Candidatus Aminicenantes bacterium]|nr:insulinase family protein [Candidatus Aminicenantes bacterium]